MRIEALDSVDPGAWQRLVDASPDAWLHHQWDWITGTAVVYGLETRCFGAIQGDRLVAALPVQVPAAGSRLPRPFARSIGMGSVGPFAEGSLSPKLRERALRELSRTAADFARARGMERLVCALPPLSQRCIENIRGVNPLLAAGWRDTSTQSLIADLEVSEEALWSGLAHDARRSVKQAAEAGYRVERGCWPELLDDYYRVHCETYERTGATPHPRAYFEEVARVGRRGHAVLWVGRDPSGRPVAFHNCGRFREGALYWTGCSETEHLQRGVNYLLFWHAILGAKKDGARRYEIGEVFPGSDVGKERGLTVFKTKFGGELHRYCRGEIELLPERSTRAGPRERLRRWRARGAAPVPEGAAERLQRERYRAVYARQAPPTREPEDYFTRLFDARVALIRQHFPGGRVLDLCCGEGEYLSRVSSSFAGDTIGVDFTPELLRRARDASPAGAVQLALGNARALPLADASVSLAYTFSALYTIPAWEEVLRECARVLTPGGVAIFDCGVRPSLNHLVARAQGGVALTRLPTLGALHAAVRAAGFEIEADRAFQLLPLWGSRPRWLRPLLHPVWKRWLSRRAGGRMLDEWISGLPGLRRFAFRHLLVCRLGAPS